MSSTTPFQNFVGSFGRYSWKVVFIKSPAETATAAYARLTGGRVLDNVSVATRGAAADAPLGAVVQLTDSDWTIIFHRLGHWDESEVFPLAHDLQTELLVFEGEDTSGQVGCRLVMPGRPTVRYMTPADAATEREFYEMTERTPPAYQRVDSYGQLFATLGITTVELTCDADRNVVIDPADAARVVRVDFVVGK